MKVILNVEEFLKTLKPGNVFISGKDVHKYFYERNIAYTTDPILIAEKQEFLIRLFDQRKAEAEFDSFIHFLD